MSELKKYKKMGFREFQTKCQYYMPRMKSDEYDFCRRETEECIENNCPLYKIELPYSKHKQLRNQVIDVQEFKAITENESILQRQCEQLLDTMKLKYYRIPDFLWRHRSVSRTTQKMMSNYFKGLPDLTVLIPLDEIYCKAVCFELKTKKGKLTGGQKSFQRKLPLIIIRSFDQFIKELNNFLED